MNLTNSLVCANFSKRGDFFMVKRVLVVFFVLLFIVFFSVPVNVTAEEHNKIYDYEIRFYDLNWNGYLDQEDIYEITQELVSGDKSWFCVLDLIVAYQILYDQNISALPVTDTIFVCELPHNEDNNSLICNWLSSDYPRKVLTSDNTVTFSFLKLDGKTELILLRNDSYVSANPLAEYHTEGGIIVVNDNYTVTVQ